MLKLILSILILSSTVFAQNSGDELLSKANQYYKSGEFTKAIVLYRKAESRNADPSQTSFNIGNSYFQIGDLPKAAAAYRKAVRLRTSGSNAAIFNLAAVLFRLEQYGEAIAAYQRGLEDDPENLSAWLYLSEAYTRNGELTGAQRALEKALNLEPNDVTIVYQLAEVHVKMREIEQAVRLVRQSYQLNPTETDFVFYIGDLYRLDKQLEKAAAAYREGLSVEPTNAEVQYKLADVLVELKQNFIAMESLNKVLSLEPENIDAAVFLGNLAFDMKWWDRSQQAYLMAVKKNNAEGIQGILNLAFEFESKKDFTRAQEYALLLQNVKWPELGQKAEWEQLQNRLQKAD